MSEHGLESRRIFDLSLEDKVAINRDVEIKIDDAITRRAVRIIGWFVTAVLSALFGAILAILWDLNGKVHTVLGQEAVRSEISEIQKERIHILNVKNSELESRVIFLQNKLNEAKKRGE
jgi:hypothetical protein